MYRFKSLFHLPWYRWAKAIFMQVVIKFEDCAAKVTCLKRIQKRHDIDR